MTGILGHGSTSGAESQRPLEGTDRSNRQLPPSKSKPITILKRPNNTTEPDVAQNSTKSINAPVVTQTRRQDNQPAADAAAKSIPIPSPNQTRTCKNPGAKGAGPVNSNTNKPTLETNPSEDSDGRVSVFDIPLPKAPGKASKSSRLNTPAAKSVAPETPPSSFDELKEAPGPENGKTSLKDDKARVRPIAYKSSTNRRAGLLTKLIHTFPDYAEAVAGFGRSLRSQTDKSPSHSIHVFVDISNIMVGFHDSVKVSRGIPVTTRLPRLPLSFENFSLILERARPTTKRVLVGSDRFSVIDEAEKLGYEANILDRVQKGKYVALRQSKSRTKHGLGSQVAGRPETNGAAGDRWVEQGVDEILHLKILESLVDTEEPTTIVLATGDAAKAEFSEGFMKMVERALQRGWTVELVSFSLGTSYAYNKKGFRVKWGDRFRMIKLDDYVEELLDM